MVFIIIIEHMTVIIINLIIVYFIFIHDFIYFIIIN